MKQRPILFSRAMVIAIQADRKTQTRRTLKFPQPLDVIAAPKLPGGFIAMMQRDPLSGSMIRCRYGEPGDQLWVKETWRADDYAQDDPERTIYQADMPDDALRETKGIIRWRPSMFMPRNRSRLSLEILDVRAQRLQDISEEDARAEGAYPPPAGTDDDGMHFDAGSFRDGFRVLWDSINDKRAPWESNPLVWAITLKRV